MAYKYTYTFPVPAFDIDKIYNEIANVKKVETTGINVSIPIKSEKMQQDIILDKSVDTAPIHLVPGSVLEDWHRHVNLTDLSASLGFSDNIGGWVYKDCGIGNKVTISADSVIYDKAVVADNTVILSGSKVYGNANVSGVIHDKSEVCGNTSIISKGYWSVGTCVYVQKSKLNGDINLQDTVVIQQSTITGSFTAKNMVKVLNSTVSGVVTLIESSQIHNSKIDSLDKSIFLFGSAKIIDANISGAVIAGYGIIKYLSQSLQFVNHRTQKAKGLQILKDFGYSSYYFKVHKIEDAQPGYLINKFVRPCPLTPRHGFVDSRLVKTEKDAIDIIKTTKTEDSLAELISMEYIKSDYSGVWTPGLLTVGRGTDGATSGVGTQSIPIFGNILSDTKSEYVLKLADITQAPYIEILWDKNISFTEDNGTIGYNPYTSILVQLRDGPKVETHTDFIPKRTKVSAIVLAEGSLLEWEKRVKQFSPGTVVYHPGGSLTSHYSVHCIINNIPVLISRKPKIGKIIRPITDKKNLPDINTIKRGFSYALTYDISYSSATYIMLLGCHNLSQWIGKEDFFLGFSLGCAFRLTILACIGEYRHYNNEKNITRKIDRSSIYHNYWNVTHMFSTRNSFLRALKIFEAGRYSSGIGGKRWFEFGKHAVNIINSLLDNNLEESLQVLNSVVNAVHNNGWAFNKFAPGSELETASKNPVEILLKVAPELYELKIKACSVDSSSLDKFFINRLKWDSITDYNYYKKLPCVFNEVCGCEEHSCLTCHPNGCSCKHLECHDCNSCDKCCECGKHECKKCFPTGCKCKNKKCHDCNKCVVCCGCLKHDCTKCYPYGCPCIYKICHDCGKCVNCLPYGYINKVQIKITSTDILYIQYKRSQFGSRIYTCSYDLNIKNSSDIENIKKTISELITEGKFEPSWFGTTAKYVPCEFNFDEKTWYIGNFKLNLPDQYYSCSCSKKCCKICFPDGIIVKKGKLCYKIACKICYPEKNSEMKEKEEK